MQWSSKTLSSAVNAVGIEKELDSIGCAGRKDLDGERTPAEENESKKW
jgi:hypothetical protein